MKWPLWFSPYTRSILGIVYDEYDYCSNFTKGRIKPSVFQSHAPFDPSPKKRICSVCLIIPESEMTSPQASPRYLPTGTLGNHVNFQNPLKLCRRFFCFVFFKKVTIKSCFLISSNHQKFSQGQPEILPCWVDNNLGSSPPLPGDIGSWKNDWQDYVMTGRSVANPSEGQTILNSYVTSIRTCAHMNMCVVRDSKSISSFHQRCLNPEVLYVLFIFMPCFKII